MLTGEYINRVDDKGRVMIPARLRASLKGEHFVLSRSFDNTKCVSLFLADDFHKTVNSAFMGEDGLQLFNPNAMRLARRFLATAVEVEFDSAGRVLLPQAIRSYAELLPKEDIVVVGMSNHIELWNQKAYDEYMNAELDYTALAREVSLGGKEK